MGNWKQALTRAISAEIAAEKAALSAEDERRSTWWATTWALADVPRAEWGEAQDEYVQRTGHSKVTAEKRRRTGTRLPQTVLAHGLPQSRFAEAAANWVGKDGDDAKVKEAIKLLAQAEKDEMSLREFSQSLTGKPWTKIAENLTEQDEDDIVERVAARRPEVIAQQVERPEVASKVVRNNKARSEVVEQIRHGSRRPTPKPPMPKPRPKDEVDKPEHVPNELELQGMITDFHIKAGDAKISGGHALDVFTNMRPYLTGEQVNDLVEVTNSVIGRWESVRDFIASGGATDEALHDLINKTTGGA